MIERQPCIYIMASGPNGTLYVGVTSNLIARIVQHRAGTLAGFTREHGIKRLVYFEKPTRWTPPSHARSS